MRMQAPITVDLRIGITNGEKVGEAVVSLPIGAIPDDFDINEAFGEFQANDMPEGFRLMTKTEFIQYQCAKYQGAPAPADIGSQDFEP